MIALGFICPRGERQLLDESHNFGSGSQTTEKESQDTGPVQCTVREFTMANAVLTMSGWLGLPSRFTLFVEPDAIRAECKVMERRGSNIKVEFIEVNDGVRYRQV